jgi:hypothetical protein
VILNTLTRALGWQTAVAESRQYQIFSFNYVGGSGVTSYTCDIAAATDTVWPNIQVYLNNVLQDTDTYTYTINPTTTVVNFTVPDTLVDTVVEITLLSDQVSSNSILSRYLITYKTIRSMQILLLLTWVIFVVNIKVFSITIQILLVMYLVQTTIVTWVILYHGGTELFKTVRH